MSLPLKAIDRLFERLQTTYGRQFSAMYEGIEPAAVKQLWMHELAGYGNHLGAIAYALENLPERAPNAIEFRNLCRKAPSPEVPRLDAPRASPERIAAELARLAPMRKGATSSGYDHKAWASDPKAWARKIIACHEAGIKTLPISLRFAREALQTPGERAGLGAA